MSPVDLFARAASKDRRGQPLAERMRPETLAAAILLRPMVVLEPAEVPDLTGKRVLI